ncbi:hypothetical protein [Lacticaseibacillus mingshuiensis]|uniref:Antitoxin VbhA domain-containing protein n=1 Tax=Lacticaseibacillus mingshuiensis TaxID=2799574 RepID=A0ABW4CMD0_9LACO|nr:hypothetical protein [Lacticaseibacillus mingshuiensis]
MTANREEAALAKTTPLDRSLADLWAGRVTEAMSIEAYIQTISQAEDK